MFIIKYKKNELPHGNPFLSIKTHYIHTLGYLKNPLKNSILLFPLLLYKKIVPIVLVFVYSLIYFLSL